MSVVIDVFYKNGLKRGDPCTVAVFQQIYQQPGSFLFPGASQYVDLPVTSQTGNRYTLAPVVPDPFNPTSPYLSFRVSSPGEPVRGRAAGEAGVTMQDGGTAEVWV
jgi:hypothetical protein